MANKSPRAENHPDGYYVIGEISDGGRRVRGPIAGPLPTKECAYAWRQKIDPANRRSLKIWRWESEKV
ncbi:UNVERIFIED_ORG: hypothetical protein J2Y81_002105 [Paraburkholderia sediminicola]|nr:hypothetical protein [Paraburkholderia sediminicola]